MYAPDAFQTEEQGWEFLKEKKKARKQETRKHALLQEKRNSLKKTDPQPRKRPRKKNFLFYRVFFLDAFFVEGFFN